MGRYSGPTCYVCRNPATGGYLIGSRYLDFCDDHNPPPSDVITTLLESCDSDCQSGDMKRPVLKGVTLSTINELPMFAAWVWRYGVTLRIFWRLFQVKLVRDEIFSQRCDPWRMRLFGLSIKLFGR